jgi:Uma2 family endonuclease
VRLFTAPQAREHLRSDVGGDDQATSVRFPPVLAIEVISPSDVAPWEGSTRIEGRRLDYAANGLAHYLEVDPNLPSVTRYGLHDDVLVAVERVVGDQTLAVTVPFEYLLHPSQLVKP